MEAWISQATESRALFSLDHHNLDRHSLSTTLPLRLSYQTEIQKVVAPPSRRPRSLHPNTQDTDSSSRQVLSVSLDRAVSLLSPLNDRLLLISSQMRDDNEREDIWDTLTGYSNWLEGVAFSPDGSRLASASHDNTVQLWDGNTGGHIATLTGHSDSSWVKV
jgi:WD40 repeat protein